VILIRISLNRIMLILSRLRNKARNYKKITKDLASLIPKTCLIKMIKATYLMDMAILINILVKFIWLEN
jgi:hypothetical protein